MLGMKINRDREQMYKDQGQWTDDTLLDRWERTVNSYPDREFVTDDCSGRYTYREMDIMSDRVAAVLRSLGVKAGNTVTYQITPRCEFVAVTVACMKLGAVSAPLGLCFEGCELRGLLEMLESRVHLSVAVYREKSRVEMLEKSINGLKTLAATLIVGDAGHDCPFDTLESLLGEPLLASERHRGKGGDLAAILCTSGTTRKSKAVMFTHNNIIFSEDGFNRELGITSEDTIFMPAPLNHATGFHHGIMSPMLCGGGLTLQERFHCTKAIAMMNRERCTYSMGATPFIYDLVAALDESGEELPYLRFYICGGAPVPEQLVRHAYDAHNILVCECYGSTESVPHLFVRPDEALEVLGRWSGRAMEGVEVRIVDDDHNPLPPNTVGEEASRGPNIFSGYWKDPEITDNALDDDGWYYSGDLCVMDEQGHVKVVGRKKDILIRGGENLNINTINDGLEGCPGVLDHAVVGMPDPRLGERICAFVTLKPGTPDLTLAEMLFFLQGRRVVKRHWPERLEIIDEIPRTESGKIKKHVLTEEVCRRMAEQESSDKAEISLRRKVQRVGPCRYLAAYKPRRTRDDVNFYTCAHCSRVLTGWPVSGASDPECCGKPMKKLKPLEMEGLAKEERLNYEILGGLNENAVRVTWGNKRPAWLYLETFRGGQYVETGNRDRRVVFALAGEDAYAYCDKDPCEECGFRCKNGFVIYAYIEGTGLVSMPLNRISATSATGVNRTRMQ